MAQRRRRRRCCASAASAPAPSGWPESSMFCQPALEALLDRRARRAADRSSVRRGRRGHRRSSRTTTACVVRAGRRRPRSRSRARYVVGCDGANSTVRDLLGVAGHDLGFFYDWLIVDVVLRRAAGLRPDQPPDLRPGPADHGGLGRSRAGGAGSSCACPTRPLDELDDEARAWELLEPWDVTPGNATLERHAVYTFQARYAERWRDGPRAARRRRRPPDAAVRRPGHVLGHPRRRQPRLEARPRAAAGVGAGRCSTPTRTSGCRTCERVIDFSMELGKVICVPDPAEAAARDEAMAAAVDRRERAEAPAAARRRPAACIRAGDDLAGRAVRAGPGRRRRPDAARFDDVSAPAGGCVTRPDGRRRARRRRWPRGSRRSAARSSPSVDRRRRRRRHLRRWFARPRRRRRRSSAPTSTSTARPPPPTTPARSSPTCATSSRAPSRRRPDPRSYP